MPWAQNSRPKPPRALGSKLSFKAHKCLGLKTFVLSPQVLWLRTFVLSPQVLWLRTFVLSPQAPWAQNFRSKPPSALAQNFQALQGSANSRVLPKSERSDHYGDGTSNPILQSKSHRSSIFFSICGGEIIVFHAMIPLHPSISINYPGLHYGQVTHGAWSSQLHWGFLLLAR